MYNKYKSLGDDGIKYTHTHKKYTIEFKIKMLKYKLENNLSYEATALYFKIPSVSVIHAWYKQYNEHQEIKMAVKNEKPSNPIQAKKNKKSLYPLEASEEVRQLKKRISELEKELYYQSALTAYLKKLEALMQEKRQK